MDTETVSVLVEEVIECFKDRWDYKSESHYTDEWEEVMANTYEIRVTFNDEGEIITPEEEIEKQVLEVAEGIVLGYEVLG